MYSVSDFFDTSIPVKARIRFDGMVHYNPPAIIKGSCPRNKGKRFNTRLQVYNHTYFKFGMRAAACSVNIRWFPFDEQECQLRFGKPCWTTLYIDFGHTSLDTQLCF